MDSPKSKGLGARARWRSSCCGPGRRYRTNDTESLPRRQPKSTPEVKTSKTSPTPWFHPSQTTGQAWGGDEEAEERPHTCSFTHTPGASTHADACMGSAHTCSRQIGPGGGDQRAARQRSLAGPEPEERVGRKRHIPLENGSQPAQGGGGARMQYRRMQRPCGPQGSESGL